MNTRLLRKLSNRVRLVEDGGYWIVQTRDVGKKEWDSAPTQSSIKKAIRSKHNLMHLFIRDIGLFPFFKERRVKKVNRTRKRLARKGKLTLRKIL